VIRLTTLGSLDLCDADGVAYQSVLAQPKRTALFAYLAVATPAEFHRRDVLAALFWPEEDESHARASLRSALHFLRRSLGPNALVTRGNQEMGLDWSRVSCDVRELREALDQGRLEEALALYAGDFLSGFHVDSLGDFERWMEDTRRRLRTRAGDAAKELASTEEAAEDLVEATNWARRALQLLPHDEEGLRRLIRLLDRSGNRTTALDEYGRFATRLSADLSAQPSPETQALIAQVKARRKPETLPEESRSSRAAKGALSPGESLVAEGEFAVRTSPRRGLVTSAAIAMIAIATLGTAFVATRGSAPPAEGDRTVERDRPVGTGTEIVPARVLVVRFENATGDSTLDAIGAMAADWITQGLAQTGLLEVISARSALRVPMADVAGLQDDRLRNGALLQLADQSGAGTIVWGSYYMSGDSLLLSARVSNFSGVLLGNVPAVVANSASPLSAVEAVRQRVVGLLAARFDERLVSWASAAATPPTYEAYLEYVAGVGAESRDVRLLHYRRAYELDSTFVTPLIQAIFLINDRSDPAVDSIIRILERSREQLAPADRLQLEGVKAFINDDRPGYYRAMREAAELSPDRLVDAGMAAFEAGLYREAAEIWGRKDLPRVWGNFSWPWYAHVLHQLGEHERALEAARQAQREMPGSLYAVYMETGTLPALGRVEELREVVDAALRRPVSGSTSRAQFLWLTGGELVWHREPEAGLEILERSLPPQFAELEEAPESAPLRERLAKTLLYLGRPEEATATLEPVVPQAEPSEWEFGDIGTYGLFGKAAALSGDRAEAERISDVLRRAEWKHEHMPALALAARAGIAHALGECDRAARLMKEMVAYALEGWNNPHWRGVSHHDPLVLICRDDPSHADLLNKADR